MSVEPESVHALTGAYVLDAVDDEERAAFEQHLAVCPYCREEVRSLRAAVVRLPAQVEAAPPPELRASVLAAITAVRPLPPLPEQDAEPIPTQVEGPQPVAATTGRADELAVRRATRRARRWRLAAAAAAVVALGGISWGLLQPEDLGGRETGTIERESDVQLDALLNAPDLQVYTSAAGEGVQGTVLRSESLGTAAMLLQDLPEAGDGEEYQAWNIVGETPSSAGVFTASDGTATVLLEGDVTEAEVMAVTIEPEGGSDAPTGDILVQVPVGA